MFEVPAVLRRYMSGLQAHDVDRVASTVSDQLAFVSSRRTLNKAQFLAMLNALYAGFPDWRYDHDPPELRDDWIAVKWRQQGTHSGSFEMPGLDPVAATGRIVTIPAQFFLYRVVDAQILEIRPEQVPGGAPEGILEQIGISSSSL